MASLAARPDNVRISPGVFWNCGAMKFQPPVKR